MFMNLTRSEPAHRSGLSVTEVLIAIFCMAIGMISLLALIPVGMLRMQAAIRDNRVSQVAANGEAIANYRAIRNDTLILDAIHAERVLFDDTNGDNVGEYMFPTTGPSPPIFIDPIGTYMLNLLQRQNPTLNPPRPRGRAPFGRCYGTGVPASSIGIPRGNLSFTGNLDLARRWLTAEDEVTFGQNAEPVLTTSGGLNLIERERKYSMGFLWRRPQWNNTEVAELSILVYSARRLTATPQTDRPIGEVSVAGPNGTGLVFTAGSRTVTVDWSTYELTRQPEAVRPGYWILDATVAPPNTYPTQGNRWLLNGYFYRVTSVDPPNGTVQTFELDRPARDHGYVACFPLGLVDVIEKGDGRSRD